MNCYFCNSDLEITNTGKDISYGFCRSTICKQMQVRHIFEDNILIETRFVFQYKDKRYYVCNHIDIPEHPFNLKCRVKTSSETLLTLPLKTLTPYNIEKKLLAYLIFL